MKTIEITLANGYYRKIENIAHIGFNTKDMYILVHTKDGYVEALYIHNLVKIAIDGVKYGFQTHKEFIENVKRAI